MKKYSIVLFNLGGPDSLESVKPFLYNLFSDPDIFKLPFGQNFFAKLLSSTRVKKVTERYRQIGGKSPILDWTELQRRMLQKDLNMLTEDFDVYTAMRYSKPMIREVAQEINRHDYKKIVLLPLYPHYSVTTTGSSFNEWKRVYNGDDSKLIYVSDYFDHPKYIKAVNDRIDTALSSFPEEIRQNVQMLFSAHGTPESLEKKGDPYRRQIVKTVASVMKARNFSHEYHICFQSKVGPMKWLSPSTDEMIRNLAERNKDQLLIIPISFVSDQLETLFELDIEYRALAESSGIDNYAVMQGLNDSDIFIEALREIVLESLHLNY